MITCFKTSCYDLSYIGYSVNHTFMFNYEPRIKFSEPCFGNNPCLSYKCCCPRIFQWNYNELEEGDSDRTFGMPFILHIYFTLDMLQNFPSLFTKVFQIVVQSEETVGYEKHVNNIGSKWLRMLLICVKRKEKINMSNTPLELTQRGSRPCEPSME